MSKRKQKIHFKYRIQITIMLLAVLLSFSNVSQVLGAGSLADAIAAQAAAVVADEAAAAGDVDKAGDAEHYYKVVFNSNGGLECADGYVLKAAGNFEADGLSLPTPTRDYYTFLGWYEDDITFTSPFTNTTTLTGNTELYAKWSRNLATVRFNTDNGTEVADITIEAGTPITPWPTSDRTGYSLVGWYKESTFITEFKETDLVAEDMTLYARWSARKSYKVYFNANGGTLYTSELTVYDGDLAEKPQDPVRDYYTFDGWYMDSKLKTEYDFATPVTKTINLYAKWKPILTSITAIYAGTSVIVGNAYDTDKLTVTAVYRDGTTEKLEEEDYLLSAKTIYMVGTNSFVASHEGFSATFNVTGIEKKVSKVEAAYTGSGIEIGGTLSRSDLVVTVTYNDGSTEIVSTYSLSETLISVVGNNKITVTYDTATTTVNVTGLDKQVNSFVAFYQGEAIIQGNSINTNDIVATLYYTDGTSEVITNFTLSVTTLNEVGMHTITISYKKDITTTVFVTCIAKQPISIVANYTGPSIEQGSSFNRDKLTVIATFNDGTEEQVTDFILASTVVRAIGENTYSVSYNGKTAKFTVNGLAKMIVGKGTITGDAEDEEHTIALTALINGQAVRENIALSVDLYENRILTKAVKKVSKNMNFVGFELDLEGYSFADNQYLPIQMEIPEGMDASKVAIYYSPNKKNILARQNGALIDAKKYEFYAYQEGCYIIIENKESALKNAEIWTTTEQKECIVVSGLSGELKVGESYQLTGIYLFGTDKDVTFVWKSSDTSVATIASDGVLKAKSPGKVNVTVTQTGTTLSTTYTILITE